MAASAQAQIETPSGKGAGNENFPVGSILLPRRLRPHVARFYAFARAIDDIADNPDLAAEDKVARLGLMADAVEGRRQDDARLAVAHRCRASLLETGVPTQHCLDLVAAFVQDATKLRYRDWDDLMGYCIRSAAPVGRYLLDLHGESKSAWPASDALCKALQVLNHLQDCKDDKRALDRVYLPEPWLAEAGGRVEDLLASRAPPGVRRVIDRLLDGTDALVAEAERLPGQLRSKRLAMESAAIVRIAAGLSAALRRRDPVAERVELSKCQFLWCCAVGAARAWL
ncbi:MAG: squalene synthase HpnC [Alphaproteobacteria bacterium]|nr:squalene synthase HpnC [Alphaproteobacteria bacterium]